jgi:lysophospholipid acyltransferase (LPLAT)-like uncharacterized protein
MDATPRKRKGSLEFLAQHVGPVFLKALGVTLRVERTGLERIEKARDMAGNVIFVFWHSRLLPLAYLHRHEGINVLVSTHQDGEYIARIIHRLGFETSRGSSTRGGIRGLRELIQAAGKNRDLGVTPDGPRGPREVVQPGAVYLAKRLGLPIIPIGVAAAPAWRMASWDRFMVPVPFARCAVVYGEPVLYDGLVSNTAIDEARADLERRLLSVNEEADHACRS